MRWAEIAGYAYPYRIGTDGTVQKKLGEKWITLSVSTDNGRAEVKLRRVNGTQRKVGVLRLMDRIFCDGYADKNNLRVTPKNGMKTDCALENLGYATQNEIGRAALRRTARKPVARTDRNGVVSVYKSLKEAAQKSGGLAGAGQAGITGEEEAVTNPLEDFCMWAMLKKPKPDIPGLKELVHEWVQMATQKTAGQRGGKDLSWDNLERVKMGILCEAVALVMSGALDGEDGDGKEI